MNSPSDAQDESAPCREDGFAARELFAHGLEPTPARPNWAAPEPAELQDLLPQYEIGELLGRGGMGAVYKALQPELDRAVAIKLLPSILAGDETFVARFRREARTLATLQHPGIVHIHDFGQTSAGHLYFVMEFVDGTDLHRMIRGPGLNPAQSLDLVSQICDALQYAHSRGVIHRDIKPANILVTRDGRVKLADFGLARPQETGSQPFTLSRLAMGTPDYMAPEQKRGEGDHRVDLYALGVMLYEMLCGQTPQGAWQTPSQRTSVDVRLDQVVIRAMQEEPARRYQQASEVKTDVEAIRGSLAHPGSLSGKRRLGSICAGAAVIAALAGLAIFWAAGRFRLQAPSPETHTTPAAEAGWEKLDVSESWVSEQTKQGVKVGAGPDGEIRLGQDFLRLPGPQGRDMAIRGEIFCTAGYNGIHLRVPDSTPWHDTRLIAVYPRVDYLQLCIDVKDTRWPIIADRLHPAGTYLGGQWVPFEFAVVGKASFGTVNGWMMTPVLTERCLAPGGFGLHSLGTRCRKLEYRVLDGVPEAKWPELVREGAKQLPPSETWAMRDPSPDGK